MKINNLSLCRLKFILLGALFCSCLNLQAQQNINEYLLSDTVLVGRKLVEYAWNNYPIQPQVRAVVEKSEHQVHIQRWSWLDRLNASFNLNEGNFTNGNDDIANRFFPRYNFSFSFSVGTILNTPREVKIAKQDKLIALEEVELQKLNLQREVLFRYYDYLFALKNLKLKTQNFEDINSTFVSQETAFTSGQISLEDYNSALNGKNMAEEARVAAEYELAKARFSLEEVLANPLELVVREIR